MKKRPLRKFIKPFLGALVLEDILPHKYRRFLLKSFSFISLFLLLAIFFGGKDSNILRAFFSLSLFFSGVFFLSEVYFYSIYDKFVKHKNSWPFEIASMIFYAEDNDVVKGFIWSDIGDETLHRLGITEKEITEYIRGKKESPFKISLESRDYFNGIEELAKELYEHDYTFKDFLWRKGASFEDFLGTLIWVLESQRKRINDEKIWSKENLSKIPGFGKNWAFGETYILERYGVDITDVGMSYDSTYIDKQKFIIGSLESILAKNHGANALIVSDTETRRMDIVRIFGKNIREGRVSPFLRHKRLFIINTNLLIESSHDKLSFERNFSEFMLQAVKAYNIILVFPNFFNFLESAKKIGVDVISLIIPFLHSKRVNILALESKDNYHKKLFNEVSLMEEIEVLSIEDDDKEGVLEILKREAIALEKVFKGSMFTYGALSSLEKNSRRLFDPIIYAEKAKDLLSELLPFVFSLGTKIVKKEHVESLISSKTGVPLGDPTKDEKDILLNLEEILHKSVIGQDEAIKAVSSALRKSRAGIRNQNKPIGSFLFLGPTGVGKTETTKALARAFFKKEENIIRFDMSEFGGLDAVERLIGSSQKDSGGLLSNAIHEKQYGVILLDEFEKTTKEVMNLFLQILDEGMFTDVTGRKINTRNTIIIATSNAGSSLIWDIVNSGKDLEGEKENIINELIRNNEFKPELLNRFDDVILFHPLEKNELKSIARIQLEKFGERMKERGIIMDFEESVIDLLVEKGRERKFGARPLSRAISEEIEEFVASAILKGTLTEGQKVTLFVNQENKIEIKK